MGEDELNVRALLDPCQYEHPVQSPSLVETHISWVILTGPFAYKIKKPLNLDFLDFSTLERRLHFCHEELRLNRRLAPELYLEVVPIRGTTRAPRLGGDGDVIDYAVKMRQFPQDALLDRLIAEGKLSPQQMDVLTDMVADFHARIPRALAGEGRGAPSHIHAPVLENFRQVLRHVEGPELRERLFQLRGWSEAAFRRLRPVMAKRQGAGFVRECHGDMHLGNMALVDGEPIIFDGIEFSEDLRWIDVMSEVAFLSTDLDHRGRPDYGARFLSRYLERTGDYDGLVLIPYYQAYRAMVRAKVTRIRLSQADLEDGERTAEERVFQQYLGQAESFTRRPHPLLVITHGLSGTGKTHATQSLLEEIQAVRVRSDVERKRLFELRAEEKSGSPYDAGIYTPEVTRRTYARLASCTEAILESGHSAIVDASFLDLSHRETFRRLAERRKVGFVTLAFRAEHDTLKARLRLREGEGRDASEADLRVLEGQLKRYEPPGEDEREWTLTVDTTHGLDSVRLLAALDAYRR